MTLLSSVFRASQDFLEWRSAHVLQCQTIQALHIFYLPNHSFFFWPPQGDPGGVMGIVPLKGDRGFHGTSGLPVRHVYAFVQEEFSL